MLNGLPTQQAQGQIRHGRKRLEEKDLLTIVGKENLRIVSKQCPPWIEEAWGFYSGNHYIFI